jgi:hypothetical protein
MSIKHVKTNLGKNGANAGRNSSGWDAAIVDVEDRIRRLRYTIRVFQTRKKAGEPLADSTELGLTTLQQHAIRVLPAWRLATAAARWRGAQSQRAWRRASE